MSPNLKTTPVFHRTNKGFTLIEAMVTVAIVAILAAIAIPSYQDFIEKGRVKNATEAIHGFLHQAKSESVVRDQDIFVDIDSADWCIGFTDKANCDCTVAAGNAAECTVDVAGADVTQVISDTDFPDITFNSDFASALFDSLRGGVTGTGTLSITSGDWSLQTGVSTGGGLITCAPSGQSVSGYKTC